MDFHIFLHEFSLRSCIEEDIHNVVSQFSLKRSRHHHDINMYCIKYIIASITKPLMHICNLSFSTEIFPDECFALTNLICIFFISLVTCNYLLCKYFVINV